MRADMRLTDHMRPGRLRRHRGQAVLGAPVGLGASTSFVYKYGDVDRRSRRQQPRRPPMGRSVAGVCMTPAEDRVRL
jgi:hypothetical protein